MQPRARARKTFPKPLPEPRLPLRRPRPGQIRILLNWNHFRYLGTVLDFGKSGHGPFPNSRAD